MAIIGPQPETNSVTYKFYRVVRAWAELDSTELDNTELDNSGSLGGLREILASPEEGLRPG
jgi:hypothetical protein